MLIDRWRCPRIAGITLLLLTSACEQRISGAASAGIEQDAEQRRTFVQVVMSKRDYDLVQKSGEALLLNIHPCEEGAGKGLTFPLEAREAADYGNDRVLLRFVVSSNPGIQATIGERCGALESAGYSFDSFTSASFRLS